MSKTIENVPTIDVVVEMRKVGRNFLMLFPGVFQDALGPPGQEGRSQCVKLFNHVVIDKWTNDSRLLGILPRKGLGALGNCLGYLPRCDARACEECVVRVFLSLYCRAIKTTGGTALLYPSCRHDCNA